MPTEKFDVIHFILTDKKPESFFLFRNKLSMYQPAFIWFAHMQNEKT